MEEPAAHVIDPELDLVLERELDVPVREVWRCWTEPERLKPWFCPRPWTTPECEIDLRPGGIFRTVLRGPGGEEHGGSGCFLAVLPERLLVWTGALGPGFRPNKAPAGVPLFTARIEMQSRGAARTHYRVIAIHADAEGAKAHAAMGFQQGWGAALDQMVALIRG